MNQKQKDYIEGLPFPVNFTCIDMLIVIGVNLVMITKEGSDKLHLVGGFVDPTDITVKSAAIRECEEEISLKVNKNGINSICKTEGEIIEFIVADNGRYDINSKHSIRSRVFEYFVRDINYEFVPGDDAKSVELIPIEKFLDLKWAVYNVSPSHLAIIMYFLGRKGLL